MNPIYRINPKTVQDDMLSIASDLMNNWLLKVGDKEFRICEIEFYYDHKKEADDPYIHGNELQSQYGRWYFHGSGLDFTIGCVDYSASILVRAICDRIEPEKHYIYGPLNVVSEIFKNFGSLNEKEIRIGLAESFASAGPQEIPIAARRVGLNPEKDKKMYDALYRFLIMPKQKHADKTGIVEIMEKSGKYSTEQIKGIWG